MKIVRDSAVRQEPAQPQAVSPEENRFSIHKSYLINGDHILQMSNYKVLLDTGMTLKGSRKYFSKAKLEFYRGR